MGFWCNSLFVFVGKTPFKGENDEETLNNIKNVNYSFEIEKHHEKNCECTKRSERLNTKNIN